MVVETQRNTSQNVKKTTKKQKEGAGNEVTLPEIQGVLSTWHFYRKVHLEPAQDGQLCDRNWLGHLGLLIVSLAVLLMKIWAARHILVLMFSWTEMSCWMFASFVVEIGCAMWWKQAGHDSPIINVPPTPEHCVVDNTLRISGLSLRYLLSLFFLLFLPVSCIV